MAVVYLSRAHSSVLTGSNSGTTVSDVTNDDAKSRCRNCTRRTLLHVCALREISKVPPMIKSALGAESKPQVFL